MLQGRSPAEEGASVAGLAAATARFVPSTASFGGTTFECLSERMILASPSLLTARAGAVAYFSSLAGEQLFDWAPGQGGNAQTFQVGEEDTTLKMVQLLCERMQVLPSASLFLRRGCRVGRRCPPLSFNLPAGSRTHQMWLSRQPQVQHKLPSQGRQRASERGRGGVDNPDFASDVERRVRWLCHSSWAGSATPSAQPTCTNPSATETSAGGDCS